MTPRTTVVANQEDLAVLAHEARLRGMSLGRMLGEVVAKQAEELRRSQRPRLGAFRSEVSIAATTEREEPAVRPFRA